MQNVTLLRVRLGEDPEAREHSFTGRVAWALNALIDAGEHGCTPVSHPAPRWSDCIFKLRRAGVMVETLHESHAGPYPGHHGRYVLRAPATIIERKVAA